MIRRKLGDVLAAAAVGLCVAGAMDLMLHLAPQRTPVESQLVTAQGAAADVAALVNSEAFQSRARQTLTGAEGMRAANVDAELKFLHAEAKRADLVEIRVLARDEYAGKRLVEVLAQAVLSDPIRFRLGELGKRHAVFSAIREQVAECARTVPAAAGRIGTAELLQIKAQSVFLAAALLREFEFQGPPENFLAHLEAMKSLGLQRLPAHPAAPSYGDIQAVYAHALCQSTYAMAETQSAIAERLVRTEYRQLYAASAPPKAAARAKTTNLRLVIPAGLIAAWLVLRWRSRARTRRQA